MSGRLIFPPSEHFWQKLLRAHHPIFGSAFPKCFVQALNSSLPSDVIRSRSCLNRAGCRPRSILEIGGRRSSAQLFSGRPPRSAMFQGSVRSNHSPSWPSIRCLRPFLVLDFPEIIQKLPFSHSFRKICLIRVPMPYITKMLCLVTLLLTTFFASFCPKIAPLPASHCRPAPVLSLIPSLCVSAAMAAQGSAACFSNRTTLPCRSGFRCRRIRHRLRRRSPPPGTDDGVCRRSGCRLSRRRGDAGRTRACWSGSLSYPVLPVVSEAASAPGLTLRSECICRCTSDDGDCYYCQKFHNLCTLFTIQKYGRVLTTLVKSSKTIK